MTNPTLSHSPSGNGVKSYKYFKNDTSANKVTDADIKGAFVEQMQKVKSILKGEHLINDARVEDEVNWYYGHLGLSTNYFEIHTAEEIAKHVSCLYSAKCLSQTNGAPLELSVQSSAKGRAFFFAHSMPGKKESPCQKIEHTIEQNYLGEGYHHRTKYGSVAPVEHDKRWRVLCYRTKGPVAPDSDIHLRFYILSEPHYKNPAASETETDMQQIADQEFLASTPAQTIKVYSEIVKQATVTNGPVIKLMDTDLNPVTKHLLIAYRSGTTHSFFSGVTDLYHSYGHYSSRKYVEHFANGITVVDIQIYPLEPQFALTAQKGKELVEEASFIYILPRTSISSLFRDGILSAKEYAYAYAAWKFVFHFLSRQSAEFANLSAALQNDPAMSRILGQIKSLVRKEAYSEGRVMEALFQYSALIKDLYKDFERRHLAYNDRTADLEQEQKAIQAKILRAVPSDFDRQIFIAFLTFNRHIVKTNFFQPSKVAISFRLNPSFLPKEDYPVTPYAIFFVVGPEFRGFHIRFRDVARGGIRIIRSGNFQAFIQNVTTLFDENYNLANTQERKNKDIAEGGSKGTILLSLDHQDKALVAFKKYVDSLLDLLLPNDAIVDYYKKEELLFLGPDEGTATYMDWASQHAKDRGYKFWKSFTTGKSRSRGGIPHDLYGMTTRSIHQYVLGTLNKLKLDESQVSKFQTGGPDGDLGSNEIKISKDKTIAVVDGSGVLYDPEGINREALTKLAEGRKMVKEFDRTKLSAKGFYVDVDATDITLPDGTVVPIGLDFRNNFHVNPLAACDIFVPCGGRPESINLNNVQALINEETKKPRWHVIVEGANLFLTQEARLLLEKKGCVIFKDASANKGGVTSSSLEVLAALSFTDEEFEQHMAVKGDVEPPFYNEYIKEVHRIIEENARFEFNCLWSEHERTGVARSILSDMVSNKINELSLSLSSSELWNNTHLRSKVLTAAVPRNLLSLLGLETILKRVPENYVKAIFGTYLASRYVYKCGLAANPEFSFYNFITSEMSN